MTTDNNALDWRSVLQPLLDEYTTAHKARLDDPEDTQLEVVGSVDHGIVMGLKIAIVQLSKAEALESGAK